MARVGGGLAWMDQLAGEQVCVANIQGDVVLARKDIATSYHLSVVVDDALQGVNLITRGNDLFASTHVHRVLQGLLDYPVPIYHHHRLIEDEHGVRLAKRHEAEPIKDFRTRGLSPADLRRQLGVAAD
jgi:glutamyl-Q tRNA(Asp) synthetase